LYPAQAEINKTAPIRRNIRTDTFSTFRMGF
jgi:hypothetical protein